MRYADRPNIRSFLFSLFVATVASASLTQTGCGTTHEPPKMDAATYEQKVKEQADIREMERASAK